SRHLRPAADPWHRQRRCSAPRHADRRFRCVRRRRLAPAPAPEEPVAELTFSRGSETRAGLRSAAKRQLVCRARTPPRRRGVIASSSLTHDGPKPTWLTLLLLCPPASRSPIGLCQGSRWRASSSARFSRRSL